jgi:uncharacterized delta-60 repeat protein
LCIFISPLVVAAQVQQAWVTRYNGPTNGWDSAVSAAVDISGNIYIAGASESSPGNLDYLTAKYLPDGTLVWTSRFNGPGNGSDSPAGVKADVNGNVYVTGTSRGLVNGDDIVTVKYDSAGMQLWTARYTSSGVQRDLAAALEIGPAGDVYVTGSSSNNTSFVTIKYNSWGAEVWKAFYKGTNGGNNVAVSLAIDAADNVYVTGYAVPVYYMGYYATLKYDASGNRVWVANYGEGGGLNYPASIAVDSSGNVHVTGRSEESSYIGRYDYATVKYAPNGASLWSAKHSSALGSLSATARALAVDGSGNVYVTGSGSGVSATDFVTIKYSPAGHQEWQSRYNGPADGADTATGIALDAGGNVYVTGSSVGTGGGVELATLKYAPNGNQLWAFRATASASSNVAGPPIVVGLSGEVYVCGEIAGLTASRDMALFRYDQILDPDYPAIVTQPAAQSVIRGSAARFTVDAGGATPLRFRWHFNGQTQLLATMQSLLLTNVQLAQEGEYSVEVFNNSGSVESPSVRLTVNYISTQPQSQIIVHGAAAYWKVVPVGTMPFSYQWQFNGANIPDATNSVFFLTNAQPFNAGWYSVVVSNIAGVMQSDQAQLSVSTRVKQAWVDARDPGHSIALDPAGHVYVTGSYVGRSSDCITCKFLPNGTRVWRTAYNGPANGFDGLLTAWTFRGRMIAVDAAGCSYITASSDGISGSPEYVTIKYDTNGEPVWIARLSGIPETSSDPVAIRLDLAANVYVTGRTGSYPSEGYMTVKYDNNGSQLWVANHPYAGPSPHDLSLDKAGNAYVTGGRHGAVLVKYDPSGNESWALTSFDEYQWALAVDSQANIITAGSKYFSGADYDYVITKFSSSGMRMWSQRYPESGFGFDSAWDVAIGPDDTIYVAGSTATVKYSPAGAQCWSSEFGGRNIKVETNGTAYLLESAWGPVTGYDYSLRKIASDGKGLWEARYGTLTNDSPMALESDHNGSIYLTGSAGTVKYTESPVPPLHLAVESNDAGGLQLLLISEAGRFYSIQASTDLRTWTTVTNLVNPTGAITFFDRAAVNFSHRFYRATLDF